MRRLVLLLPAFFLAVAAAPPPPDALTPYIHLGRFDPGDYGWMRGRFADATPAERAQTAAIEAWLDRCRSDDIARIRAELKALGIADPKLERFAFADPLCGAVWSIRPVTRGSFEEFQRDAAAARPVAETWLYAVRTATDVGAPRRPSVADMLLARPLGEQMLRRAASWGEGDMKGAPALSPGARAVLVSRITGELAAVDHANTEWLKRIVATEGWPTISRVGAPASEQAWLLVQHADADPVFQLRVLRLMEPLTRSGDVSKRNYAYLYDRVMHKLTGKQRYGTQMECRNGQRAPQPLEDEANLARERKAMDLEPLDSYLEQMRQSYGDCPPDPS